MNRVVARIRALLPQGRFARGVTLLAGGTVATQMLSVVVMPLITRLFPQEAFGILASYMAMLMMVQTVVGLRYEQAIPLAETDRDALLMLLVTLCAVACFSIVALMLAVLFATGLLHSRTLDLMGSVIWLLPVGIVLSGIYQSLRYWAIRDRAYRDIAATTMTQGVGRSLTQLGSSVIHAGTIGLVFGEIVGQSAGIAKLGRSAVRKTKEYWAGITRAQIGDAARRNASFPLLLAPGAFINGAGIQLPTLLIATLFGAKVAGFYYVSQRLLGLPIQFIGVAIGQVFMGEAAVLARTDPKKLERLSNTLTRKLLLAGILPTAALILVGPWAMERFLGHGWAESGVYLQWLSINFLLKLGLDGQINLSMVERNDYALIWAIIRLVLACGGVLAAYWLKLSPTWAIAMLSIGLSLGYLLKFWFWQRALHQLQRAFP